MNFPTPSLKSHALRLLGLREYSRAELERKLRKWGTLAAEGELARVLDELEQKGLISEERVVETHLFARAGKLGSARVLEELRLKGVGQEALAQAQQTLQDTELERARQVWAKKFSSPPSASDAKERARQLRFLAYRGFSPEIAFKVVQGGPDQE